MRRQFAAIAAVVASVAVVGSAGDASLRGAHPPDDFPLHHDTIDPLSVCLLAIDEDVHYNDSGEAVSVIPIGRVLFAKGVFIQDSRQLDKCPNNATTPSTCFEHNSSTNNIICELCTYSDTADPAYIDLVPCRKDTTDIAVKCLDGPCIDNAPSPKSFLEALAPSTTTGRNLIFADSTLGTDRSQWMTSLHEKGLMNGATLNDLVLPGSHNSAAVALEAEKHCGKVNLQIDKLAEEVAKNQDIGLAEQLRQGIRFLDLRVIENTNFYGLKYPLHHSYLIHEGNTKTLYQAFDLVETFLENNPKETVIIRVDGFPNCREAGMNHKGRWKTEIALRPRLRLLVPEHLTGSMNFVQGVALIDVDRSHIYEDWPGPNFGADTWNDNNGPFEYGRYFKHNDGTSNKFTVWPFFPNIAEYDIAKTLANPFFDGLEDWDVPYMNHMWMMHSLIGLRAKRVNAIITDRVGQTSVYDVATRLTLYRLFEKAPAKWDAVQTQEYINALDEEFEHHCPPKYALQGFYSDHDNRSEDRQWKFVCRRVEWLDEQSWCGGSSGWQKRQYHPSAFRTNFDFLLGSVNEFDNDVRFYWEDGKYAITGMGGKHSNRHADRRFYFYASLVTKEKTECSWTSFVNVLDRQMDYQTKPNEWVAGIISQHSNWNEDRRWKFYICR